MLAGTHLNLIPRQSLNRRVGDIRQSIRPLSVAAQTLFENLKNTNTSDELKFDTLGSTKTREEAAIALQISANKVNAKQFQTMIELLKQISTGVSNQHLTSYINGEPQVQEIQSQNN